jgi:glycosyltransferase involved in cell wall biosynthesis
VLPSQPPLPSFSDVSRPELSIVAPMFNEEANVSVFVRAVLDVLVPAGVRSEIVLVDDGSSDGTWEAIVAASKDHPNVRGVALSRNFGHQGALLAGLNLARGHAVVTMDGDLQHPPAMLLELLSAWKQGYQVVNTERKDSEDTSFFKRATSRWFYWIFSRFTGVPMNEGSSDFRLLDRRAVDALLRLGDADLFIRGLVSWLGYKSFVVPYRAERRHSGVSKFTLSRMLKLSGGAMMSFSAFPLRLGIFVGFLTSGLAFLELCYIFYTYAQGRVIPGWASVMTVMSLMFGVLFVLLGIIGTYIAKVYDVLKRRPRFVVGQLTGFSEPSVELERAFDR